MTETCPCLVPYMIEINRGVGSIKRFGGGEAVSRGTFGMKRVPEYFPPEMLATGWREGKIIAIIKNTRPSCPSPVPTSLEMNSRSYVFHRMIQGGNKTRQCYYLIQDC
jgi:hypothetical protein